MSESRFVGPDYLPHLDAVRGVAILLVVLFHANVPWFSGGYIGVDIFFVLSGYLVTRSLMLEAGVLQFYLKRVRRLVPALSLMLIVYLVSFSFLKPDHPNVRDSVIAFFYLSDYAAAYWGAPKYLIHTWSLAVEEHFYILWPLVFVFLKPRFWHLLIAYVVFSVWRWVQDDWLVTYYSFDTRLSGLVLGCSLAYLNIELKFTSLLGLIFIALCSFYYISGEMLFQEWGVMIVELSAVMLIVARPPPGFVNPVLVYIGKISYGIYLWHYPVMRYLASEDQGWHVVLIAGGGGAFVCAALSYRYFEPLFWKRRNENVAASSVASLHTGRSR